MYAKKDLKSHYSDKLYAKQNDFIEVVKNGFPCIVKAHNNLFSCLIDNLSETPIEVVHKEVQQPIKRKLTKIEEIHLEYLKNKNDGRS
jgi:hypothetical protein